VANSKPSKTPSPPPPPPYRKPPYSYSLPRIRVKSLLWEVLEEQGEERDLGPGVTDFCREWIIQVLQEAVAGGVDPWKSDGQRFLLADLLKGLGSVDFQAVAEAAAKKVKGGK
jgi:hypothetical protein